MRRKIYFLLLLLQEFSNHSACRTVWEQRRKQPLGALYAMENAFSLSHKDIPLKNWKLLCIQAFQSDITAQAQLHQCKSPGSSDCTNVQACVSTIKHRCQVSPQQKQAQNQSFITKCFRGATKVFFSFLKSRGQQGSREDKGICIDEKEMRDPGKTCRE